MVNNTDQTVLIINNNSLQWLVMGAINLSKPTPNLSVLNVPDEGYSGNNLISNFLNLISMFFKYY
jgi:hypothetical protein